ncbi:UNVERIFIED_CONTAM: hypothetical protein FKN15_061908 [Acipenser sinensis]
MALAITVQTALLCITGDEILELNGKSLHGLTHTGCADQPADRSLVQLLRRLPPVPLALPQLQCHHQQPGKLLRPRAGRLQLPPQPSQAQRQNHDGNHFAQSAAPLRQSRTPLVSEQQLNEAIAQAVENSKLKKVKSQWSIEALKKNEPCSHGKQKCEKCLERSFSQLNNRRPQKLMIRSSSDTSSNHRSPCSNGGSAYSTQQASMKCRVHSVDVPMTAPQSTVAGSPGWSVIENKPSPPHPDDYNVPKSKHSSQQSIDFIIKTARASKPKPPPRRYFKQQEDSKDEHFSDHGGVNGDSPNDWKPSTTKCQVGFYKRNEPLCVLNMSGWLSN